MKFSKAPGLAFLVLFAASCSKDEPLPPQLPDPCLATSDVDLKMSVNMVFGDQTFATGTSFQLNDSIYVSFNEARFYISNVTLLHDSVWTRATNDVVIVDEDHLSFNLGKYPQQNIQGIRFSLGIDSVRNHEDPTQYPAGHPLAFSVPSMHWSWNQGYIFALLEGRFSSQPITQDNPGEIWYFHIGLDENYQQSGNLPASIQVKACADNTIRLKADMMNIFSGVDFNGAHTTLSTDNAQLANRVSDHLMQAITNEN
ncbi:MAG: MbnP family protein [Bacteroidia bacterium]